MRKILYVTVFCFALMLAGCAESGNSSEKELTTAQTAEVDILAESHVIPPREAFAEIPAEAEQAFDHVIKTIDKSYPKSDGGVRRYFGYTGEEIIDGAKCYVFTIYDSSEEAVSKVVTAAVSDDCVKVFGMDDDSGIYRLIEES